MMGGWLLWSAAAAAAPLEMVRVSAFTESIAVPFTVLVPRPLHPGVAVGASIWSRTADHFGHQIVLEVGGYHHPLIENALLVLPSWQTTWKAAPWLGVSVLGGVGYKHALYPAQTFRQDEATGDYVEARSGGHPGLLVTGGLGVSVPISARWAALVQYRAGLETGFSPTLGIPVMTHLTGHLGMEYRR